MIANRVLRAGFLRDIHDARRQRHPRRPRRPDVFQILRHLVKFLRAHDQIDVGQLVQELGPAVLRHAAEDPEHEVGLVTLAMRDVGGLADGLLLGGVTDAAGVEQQHIAIVFARHDSIAPGTQHRRDRLAVALVHLAPVGFDVDPVHP